MANCLSKPLSDKIKAKQMIKIINQVDLVSMRQTLYVVEYPQVSNYPQKSYKNSIQTGPQNETLLSTKQQSS